MTSPSGSSPLGECVVAWRVTGFDPPPAERLAANRQVVLPVFEPAPARLRL